MTVNTVVMLVVNKETCVKWNDSSAGHNEIVTLLCPVTTSSLNLATAPTRSTLSAKSRQTKAKSGIMCGCDLNNAKILRSLFEWTLFKDAVTSKKRMRAQSQIVLSQNNKRPVNAPSP